MRRIAIIGNSSETLVRFRLSLIERLSRNNLVYAVCPHFNSEDEKTIRKVGAIPVVISSSRFGMNPVREISSIFELVRFFMDYRINVSFSYFIKPVIYCSIASFLAGVHRRVCLVEGLGYVFTPSVKPTFKLKLLKTLISNLLKVSIPLSHKIIFLNKDDASEIQNIVPLKFDPVILGGIGVDLDYYKSYGRDENSKLTFLLVARILKEKGIFEFIEAAKKVDSSEMEFWIAGGLDDNPGGIGKDVFEQAIRGTNVKWLGAVSDVRFYLNQCDVFVLPSYREGLPRSTQEAMAMGKPIITTDVEGCRDTVVSLQNGLLVKARSPEDLSEAFSYFKKNPDQIKPFGEHSRELAEQRYSSKLQDERLMNSILGE